MMSDMRSRDRVEAVYRTTHPRLWRSLLTYTADAELASVVEKFGRLLSDWSRDLQQVPAEHAR